MKHGAQVIFTERLHAEGDPGCPGWDGRLLNRDAMDRQTGNRASNVIMRIDYTRPYGSHDGYGEDAPIKAVMPDGSIWYEHQPYLATIQGHSKYARQRIRFGTLHDAQAHIAAWARRRFYVEGGEA